MPTRCRGSRPKTGTDRRFAEELSRDPVRGDRIGQVEHFTRGSVFRSVLVIAAAAIWSSCSKSPTTPSLSEATTVRYTALGASDTIGFGGSVTCIPFLACPDGTGYVQLAARRLQGQGRTVTLVNLGIPGAVLSPEIQAVGNSIGRRID